MLDPVRSTEAEGARPVCCDNLVCASCARPVVEARCSVCRSARAELHGGRPMSLTAFLLAMAALMAIALLLAAHA